MANRNGYGVAALIIAFGVGILVAVVGLPTVLIMAGSFGVGWVIACLA